MDKIVSFVTKIWDILEELLEYFGNAKMIIYVSLALMAITLITHLLFKKIRIIKYLPGLIVVGIGAYNFYEVKDLLTAETSLSNLLLFVIGVTAGLVAMLFALILGVLSKPVKIRRKKRVQNKEQAPDKETSNGKSEGKKNN